MVYSSNQFIVGFKSKLLIIIAKIENNSIIQKSCYTISNDLIVGMSHGGIYSMTHYNNS